jgi:uncharacterized YceG family protein
MEERPTGVRNEDGRSSTAARRVATLVGVLAGFGLLAAIAFAFAGSDGEPGTPAEETTTAAATTTDRTAGGTLRIIFPEGFTRAEMAERIGAVNEIAEERRGVEPRLRPRVYLRDTERVRGLPRSFQNADAPHLEGFLFPATYDFTRRTTSRQLVDLQLEAFGRNWRQVNMRYARSRKLTPYDVLIIASMVEEEVQVPRERRLVAAVIYNRLRAGMPLGIDSTIRYGLGIPPTEAIRASQLESDSPYNTRRFTGLPPTPITNPGLASLQAAARPARVDYLFFIRKPDCRSHFFTASEEEFDQYPRAGLQC